MKTITKEHLISINYETLFDILKKRDVSLFNTLNIEYYKLISSLKSQYGPYKLPIDDDTISKYYHELINLVDSYTKKNKLKSFSPEEKIALFAFVNTDVQNIKKYFNIKEVLNHIAFAFPSFRYDGTLSLGINNKFFNITYDRFLERGPILDWESTQIRTRNILTIFNNCIKRPDDNNIHKFHKDVLSIGFTNALLNIDPNSSSNLPKNITNKLELKIFESSLIGKQITQKYLNSHIKNIKKGDRKKGIYSIDMISALDKVDPSLKNKDFFLKYVCSPTQMKFDYAIYDNNVPLFMAEAILKKYKSGNGQMIGIRNKLVLLTLFKNIKNDEITHKFIKKIEASKLIPSLLHDHYFLEHKTDGDKLSVWQENQAFSNETLTNLFFTEMEQKLSQ